MPSSAPWASFPVPLFTLKCLALVVQLPTPPHHCVPCAMSGELLQTVFVPATEVPSFGGQKQRPPSLTPECKQDGCSPPAAALIGGCGDTEGSWHVRSLSSSPWITPSSRRCYSLYFDFLPHSTVHVSHLSVPGWIGHGSGSRSCCSHPCSGSFVVVLFLQFWAPLPGPWWTTTLSSMLPCHSSQSFVVPSPDCPLYSSISLCMTLHTLLLYRHLH